MELSISISNIVIENRIRKDLGDIPGLASSIKENGLIEPIVLTHKWTKAVDQTPERPYVSLVAGERRLTALKLVGLTELIHATHFIWRSELDKNPLLAASIEMEENLRRKDLTWQEVVTGKQKLLALMQQIHGLPTNGRPSSAQSTSTSPGFGVNKLASMLGESAAQTSTDLEMAALVTKFPILANEPSREAAKRKLELAMKIAIGQNTPHVAEPLKYQILITCKDEADQRLLLEEFKKAGLTAVPVIS